MYKDSFQLLSLFLKPMERIYKCIILELSIKTSFYQ